MKQRVETFPGQLEEAINIAKSSSLSQNTNPISNIVICGLGGSGIGGTIASKIIEKEGKLPITICNGYNLPGFVSESTLVIASSYSGNTEETLNCIEQAIEKNAQVACITSGGKLSALADEKSWNKITIPGGFPPRSCIGYSLVQQLHYLNHFGVVSNSYLEDLNEAKNLLISQKESIIAEAKEIASKLNGTIPVIYSTDPYEGVAIRFRQQINENSKMLCWHHKLPEMNHNELVGWTESQPNVAVVILKNEDDYYRTAKRMDFSQKVVSKFTNNVIEIKSKGSTFLQRCLYLIHLTDWVSVFIADEKGIDPVEIAVIDTLKQELATLK